MLLTLSPQRSSDTLVLERYGDLLTFNGAAVNLGEIPEGGDGYDPEWTWIIEPVTRVDGQLRVTISLPIGPDASDAALWPEPLTLTDDGPVSLPE